MFTRTQIRLLVPGRVNVYPICGAQLNSGNKMDLSLNSLFYSEHRWTTKILSHKTESFYFHQNIWKSDFSFQADTPIPWDLCKAEVGGPGPGLGPDFKHSSLRESLFHKVSSGPGRPVRAVGGLGMGGKGCLCSIPSFRGAAPTLR